MNASVALTLLFLLAAGSVSSQEEDSTPSILSGAIPPTVPPQSSEVTEPDVETPPALAAASASATPPAGGSEPATKPPGPKDKKGEKLDFLQRSNLILGKLLDNHREVDPFGLIMDPANTKETPLFAEQYQEKEEKPGLSASSLQSALLALPITGVYPQKKEIVIGARSFPIGGQFGIRHQDLTIRLRFEGIRAGELFFKDMETQEVTSIPYHTRPAEFEPITGNAGRPSGSDIVPMNGLYIAN